MAARLFFAATALVGLCAAAASHCEGAQKCHDYCVIGAGPAGLQLSYFLKEANRDYVVIDRGFQPANFYVRYPRHRDLISINKRWTGREMDTEGGRDYNMRHDWHSLLTKHDELLFKHFSEKFYPKADEYLEYSKKFVEVVQPKIDWGRNVDAVYDGPDGSYKLLTTVMEDNGEWVGKKTAVTETYGCRYLVAATGLFKEYLPDIKGIEHAESYATMDTNPKRFTNLTVAIVGQGNAGFELYKDIMHETAYVHMIGTDNGLKLAWETHYVGNLRSINAIPLDNYQLKSQDVIDTFSLTESDDTPPELRRQLIKKTMPDGREQVCVWQNDSSSTGTIDEDEENDQRQQAEDLFGVTLAKGNRPVWDGESRVDYMTSEEIAASSLDQCYDKIIFCTGNVFDS